MRLHTVYFFALTLLAACDGGKNKTAHRLTARKVYVIKHTPQEGEPLKSLHLQTPDTSYLEYVFKPYSLVNIHDIDTSVKIDLRYAGTANFMKRNLYDGLNNAYLNCEAAICLANAQYHLKRLFPHYTLLVFDASRPQHIQQMMWDSLAMHPDVKFSYLAPPYETSLHNYGCAVDVSVYDHTTNALLDMGTDFDFFGKLSQPLYENRYLASGELSPEALENRKLLRRVMKKAGFNPINSEWWHFSTCSKAEAITRYALIK